MVEQKNRSLAEKFKLSPREFDCLVLTIYGFTVKHMAKFLSISDKTAEGYIRSACIKFQVSRKDELRFALESQGVDYLNACLLHYQKLKQKL